MHWTHLTEETQLKQLIIRSEERAQVIFKHSTRCSISNVALTRMQNSPCPENADFYFLDLLAYRPLSNKIADVFRVHHESPQVLVIRKGECTYEESHLAISMDEIRDETTV